MHVVDFLSDPEKYETGCMVVLTGKESFLKQRALHVLAEQQLGDEAELGLVRLAGESVELRDVLDELQMLSMWGERKIVYVEEAADFVSEHRSSLEKYSERPAKHGLLVLDVKAWPKTTRLAKFVAKHGLPLECTEMKGAALSRWLSEQARTEYDKQLTRDAATLMIELVGPVLGLLDSELAKVAAFVGDLPQITVEDVRKMVGSWRTETTWNMLDAVRDGRVDVALSCLDKLLVAGEPALKIMGGVTFVFRKFAQATELSRCGTKLHVALQESGIFPRDLGLAERYLRRVGRPSAERIYSRLVAADEDLKGRSALKERSILESLLVELAGSA